MMPFYIYRHIRPDTDEVFYIGKGSRLSRKNNQRMISKERNIWWKRIVELNNGEYIKEIIYECETEKECFEKEKEFIKLYGRKDLRLGTLVNLTDGGDGATGIIITEKQKKETSIRSSKKVINVLTGEIYYNARVTAEKNGISYTQLCGYLTGKLKNTSPFVYYSIYLEKGGDYCKDNIINRSWIRIGSSKKVVDIVTGEIFNNAKEAGIIRGIKPRYLRAMLRGQYNNKTTLRYV